MLTANEPIHKEIINPKQIKTNLIFPNTTLLKGIRSFKANGLLKKSTPLYITYSSLCNVKDNLLLILNFNLCKQCFNIIANEMLKINEFLYFFTFYRMLQKFELIFMLIDNILCKPFM